MAELVVFPDLLTFRKCEVTELLRDRYPTAGKHLPMLVPELLQWCMGNAVGSDKLRVEAVGCTVGTFVSVWAAVHLVAVQF